MYLDSYVTVLVHSAMEVALRALADESRRTMLETLPGGPATAQRRVYGLRPKPLAEIDEWLGRYRALWQQRLDALHTEIARGKRERRSTR
jgi:hypothetical protein